MGVCVQWRIYLPVSHLEKKKKSLNIPKSELLASNFTEFNFFKVFTNIWMQLNHICNFQIIILIHDNEALCGNGNSQLK